MMLFSLAFLSGIVLLQFFTSLPPLSLVFFSLLASLLLYSLKLPLRLYLAPALLGFAWSLWWAHSIAAFTLLPEWEDKNVWLKGKILSLPHDSFFQTSFLFHVTEIQD